MCSRLSILEHMLIFFYLCGYSLREALDFMTMRSLMLFGHTGVGELFF